MVTGPFVNDIYIEGLRSRKTWYRQRPPFRDPLPYRRSLYEGRYSDSVSGAARVPATFLASPCMALIDGDVDALYTGWRTDSLGDFAYRKAYDSLVRAMKSDEPGSSMGQTVGEARSSFAMIADRLTRLNTFGKLLLTSGTYVPRVAAVLLLNQRNAARMERSWPTRKAVANDIASSYLELIFGWGPLLKDIQDAINVLQTPPMTGKVSGYGSQYYSINRFLDRPPWLPPSGWLREAYSAKLSRRVQCIVEIDNPNRLLANRLGFVNLPAIAWELIPGSFLVDWFIPIGRFLESYTDFVGRRVSKVFMTVKTRGNRVLDSNYAGAAGRGLELSEDWGTSFQRYPLSGLPTPARFGQFRLPVSGLQSRAVTMAALFTQAFIKP